MDLGAYAQIDDLGAIAKENGIFVPRLRGYRLMANEEPISDDLIKERACRCAMSVIDNIVRSGFEDCWIGSRRTDKRVRRFLVIGENDIIPVGVRWDKVHGKLRKRIKYEFKKALVANRKQFEVWNKYCGESVLYVHARIGGNNWYYYGDKVKYKPWFIEKVDDAFDSTYCDIYVRLK